jgi:hypothetical protein
MPAVQNIAGKRFGRLVAIRDAGASNSGGRIWLCKCDCGGSTNTCVGYLNIGKTKSCGCLQKEAASLFGVSRRKPGAAFRRLFQDYKGNAKKGSREFSLTEEQFRSMTQSLCFYCGRVPTQIKTTSGETYLYNGLDRVNSAKGYSESNSVPCCWVCNQMKSTLSQEVFLQAAKRISAHQKEKDSK